MIRTLAQVVFWAGPLVALYAYAVFPGLLTLLSLRRRRRPRGSDRRVHPAHVVTVVIPAYNEERHIEARIQNVLASDYPPDLLDVIVVSDASTDRTNAIAHTFTSRGVRLLVQTHRRGKTAGLNLANQFARGEIIVFTDANAEFPPDTIRTLARCFDDRCIGLVTGHTKYRASVAGEVADATNAYTALEMAIKRAESRWGYCVGADGAVFAMRHALYRSLRDDDINDLVLPLSVIAQGYRCVLAEAAFCTETPGATVESEFRRQSRITNRSLRAIWRHAFLLNPIRFPMFSVFLFSHKILRFLTPVLLLASVLSLLLLSFAERLYLSVAGAAIVGALLVAITAAIPRMRGRSLRLVYMFSYMNLAILNGWWKFLRGNAEITWQHNRVELG